MKTQMVLSFLFWGATALSPQPYIVPGQSVASQNRTQMQMDAATRTQVISGNAQMPESKNITILGLQDKLTEIEQFVEQKRKEQHLPGCALAIVKDDKVIFLKGFGLRSVERRLPVTPDTLFTIASCTKSFIAMAAAISQDEGKLRFDDSPKKYLPYFHLSDPYADANITLRDMLCHRTGLSYGAGEWPAYSGRFSRKEVVRLLGMVRPTARLRERYQYSNHVYEAAGEVIAKAQDMPIEEVVSSRIFRPLDMVHSLMSLQTFLDAPDHSEEYQFAFKNNSIVGTDQPSPRHCVAGENATVASGGIRSSVRDMAQWVRFILGKGVYASKRIVSDKSFEEVVTPHTHLWGSLSYGLGWFIKEDGKRHLVWQHDGGRNGFGALVAAMPDQGVGLVFLMNVRYVPLRDQVEDLVFRTLTTPTAPDHQAPLSQAQPTSTPTQEEFTASVGNYLLTSENLTYKVSLQDSNLYLTAPDKKPCLLEPTGKYRYRYKASNGQPVQITFRQAEAENARRGAKKELVLEAPGGTLVLTKIEAGAPIPYVAPLSVATLMAKAVQAAGSEATLRRLSSIRMTFTCTNENTGVVGKGVQIRQAPDRMAEWVHVSALGKEFGTLGFYCDGSAGGQDGTDAFPTIGYGPHMGASLDNDRVAAFFLPFLNWRKRFQAVRILRTDTIDGKEVYVVKMIPHRGEPVTEYLSTSSFLLLKEDSPALGSCIYDQYQMVGGINFPFQWVQKDNYYGTTVFHVTAVQLNGPVSQEDFRPLTRMPVAPHSSIKNGGIEESDRDPEHDPEHSVGQQTPLHSNHAGHHHRPVSMILGGF